MLNEVKHLVVWQGGGKCEILRPLRSLRMTSGSSFRGRMMTLIFPTPLFYM